MSISVLARVHPDRDVLVTDRMGRVLYWNGYRDAEAHARRLGVLDTSVVYEAADREVLMDRIGVSADDLVHASSAVN